MPGWVVGNKSICAYLGGISIRTYYRWRKAGLPVMRTPDGSNILIPELAQAWMIKFNELKKNDRVNSSP